MFILIQEIIHRNTDGTLYYNLLDHVEDYGTLWSGDVHQYVERWIASQLMDLNSQIIMAYEMQLRDEEAPEYNDPVKCRDRNFAIMDDYSRFTITGPNGCPVPDEAIIVGYNGIPSMIFYKIVDRLWVELENSCPEGFPYPEIYHDAH